MVLPPAQRGLFVERVLLMIHPRIHHSCFPFCCNLLRESTRCASDVPSDAPTRMVRVDKWVIFTIRCSKRPFQVQSQLKSLGGGMKVEKLDAQESNFLSMFELQRY